MAETSDTAVEDIVSEMRERFDQAFEHERENREHAKEDLKILTGNSWRDEDRAMRDADERPCMTFPVLNQYVDQVIGDWRQNRAEIKITPGPGQVQTPLYSTANGKQLKPHELYEGLIRSFVREPGARVARDTAFEQAVSTGFGHYRIVTEHDPGGFYLKIKAKRITDQFSVYWDPASENHNRSDANWCLLAVDMPLKEYERRWPEAQSAADLPVPDELSDWLDSSNDNIRICEYFKRIPVSKTLCLLSDGRVVEKNEEYEKIKDELEAAGITVEGERKTDDYKVEWRLMSGMDVLEGPTEFPCKYIPVVSVYGKESNVGGGEVRYRSLIRYSHDAQRMFDYMRTSGVEAMALTPRSQFVIGASQLGNYDEIWGTANTRSHAFLPYDDSVNANPPQRSTPGYPAEGFFREALAAREDIKASVGMYDASVGQRSNEVSGKAIVARQKESDVMSFPFIDNMGRAIEYEGMIYMDMIPRVMDTQRAARMLNMEGDSVEVVLNQKILDEDTGEEVVVNDLSIGMFEVHVDIGPSYSTRRTEAAESMMLFAQNMPDTAAYAADLIATNMDWPGAEQFSKRLKMLLPPEIQQMEDAEKEGQEPMPPQFAAAMRAAEQQMQEMQAVMQELQPKLQEAEQRAVAAEQKITASQVEGRIKDDAARLAKDRMQMEFDKRVVELQKKFDDIEKKLTTQAGEESKKMVMDHQQSMQAFSEVLEAVREMGAGIQTGNEQTTLAMTVAMEGVAAAAHQMSEAANKVASYLGAERKIVTDSKGNPVGIEIAGFGERAVARDKAGVKGLN